MAAVAAASYGNETNKPVAELYARQASVLWMCCTVLRFPAHRLGVQSVSAVILIGSCDCTCGRGRCMCVCNAASFCSCCCVSELINSRGIHAWLSRLLLGVFRWVCVASNSHTRCIARRCRSAAAVSADAQRALLTCGCAHCCELPLCRHGNVCQLTAAVKRWLFTPFLNFETCVRLFAGM